jgi:hypothetical protein
VYLKVSLDSLKVSLVLLHYTSLTGVTALITQLTGVTALPHLLVLLH